MNSKGAHDKTPKHLASSWKKKNRMENRDGPSGLYMGGGAWISIKEDTERFKGLGLVEGFWLYVSLFHLPMNPIP